MLYSTHRPPSHPSPCLRRHRRHPPPIILLYKLLHKQEARHRSLSKYYIVHSVNLT